MFNGLHLAFGRHVAGCCHRHPRARSPVCRQAGRHSAACTAGVAARTPNPNQARLPAHPPSRLPQDAVADLPSAHFVGVLQRLRKRLAPLLLPPRFDSPRDIRWHSAADALAEPVWDLEAAAEAGVAPGRDGNYIAFSGAGGRLIPPFAKSDGGAWRCDRCSRTMPMRPTRCLLAPPAPGLAVHAPGGQAVYVGVNPYPHTVSAALPQPPVSTP